MVEKKKKGKKEKMVINTKDIKAMEISLELSVHKEEFDKLLKTILNGNNQGE